MLVSHIRREADFRPAIAPRVFNMSADHPGSAMPCPACDRALGYHPTVLVPVGIGPDHRKDGSWTTAASIGVHLECAGYTEAEVEAMAAERHRTGT